MGASEICLALLFVMMSFPMLGQSSFSIRKYTFEGNSAFSSQEILSSLSLQRGSVYSESEVQAAKSRMEEFYHSQAYLFARVDSIRITMDSTAQKVDLLFFLTEGDLCRIGEISINGCKGISEDALVKGMRLVINAPFLSGVLDQDIQRMLSIYEQAGYPLAKIRIQDLFLRDSASVSYAHVQLVVDEGLPLRISKFQIEGNQTTKDHVIIREARVKNQQNFTSDLPEKVKRRLERVQLFSSVELPEFFVAENQQGGLLMRVTEGNHNNFDGVLGYVPSSAPNTSGYVTGLVNVSMRNLFGTGRKLSFRWYQENVSTQETEIHYSEPWIASYPLNGQLGFMQRKQDSLFVRNQYELGIELMVSEEFSVGGAFLQISVYPTEGYGRSMIPENTTINIGATIRYDSRDNRGTPTQGILYMTEYSTGTKTMSALPNGTGGSSSTTQRLMFDFSYYTSPFQRQIAAAEMHVRSISNGAMDMSDFFRLGGATTLRGYKEGQFSGSRIAWINLEYRLLVASRSFFYVFVDEGYIFTPSLLSGSLEYEQYKLGYGIGMRVDSPVGLIGVSLAFGEGDTFSTSKLHFRLINEF